MALPLFAVTLFVSAFLLFLVQPMIGKMILPRLGGTPQVWNTCMVFFQGALLAGYAYTHTTSTRLPLRRQLLIHALFLIVPFAVLLPVPFYIGGFVPPPGANPLPYTIGFLAQVVGLPFLVVATSAPLLQKWFAYTGHPAAKDPYFLYGASNLGSLLALLCYPFLLEPYLLLRAQAVTWTVGYAVLLVLVLACAYLVWDKIRLAPEHGVGHDVPPPHEEKPPVTAPETSTAVQAAPPPPAPSAAKSTAIKKGQKHPHKHPPRHEEPSTIHRISDDVTPWRRLRWVGLAAVPSSLMLGITTHITTDLSPIPLFWLIPLTLYLLSFILVFSRWPVPWTGDPHNIMLVIHPIAMALMVFVEITQQGAQSIYSFPVLINVVAFFLTAMVCHGEFAKDRPSTKHLTEYYLLMSVGGAVGGMFNGLLAPVLFKSMWELPLAIMAACLLRPTMRESGWSDEFVDNMMNPQTGKGHKGKDEEGMNIHLALDFALPALLLVYLFLFVFALRSTIFSMAESMVGKLAGNSALGLAYFIMFGLPLVVACFYYGRPLRFGLSIAAVLLVHHLQDAFLTSRNIIVADRSYFGIIRVEEAGHEMYDKKVLKYRRLMHGNIDHGMNFKKPDDKFIGNPTEDFSRLATTYYHRRGPAGIAMKKFDWFYNWADTSKPEVVVDNTFYSDVRLPASLVGMVAPLGLTNLPIEALSQVWSEPPYATIGLGTGTMASYGRPFQHVHFYEIDNHIRKLSLPLRGKPFFTYLDDAKNRGAQVQVFMGDARLRMALQYSEYNEDKEKLGQGKAGGPDNFYHLMVVDAFSSDAIPVHLLTRESFLMYFKKLREDGVLCVHTSNRYVELVKVVADVADSITWEDLGSKEKDAAKRTLVCLRGHDLAPGGRPNGHYNSEWIMVARSRDYLKHLVEPAGYQDKLRKHEKGRAGPYWNIPEVSGRHVWTDDYSNLIGVLRSPRED